MKRYSNDVHHHSPSLQNSYVGANHFVSSFAANVLRVSSELLCDITSTKNDDFELAGNICKQNKMVPVEIPPRNWH
jgi:hypothetical protein